MKILYLYGQSLPSRSANSVNVMKMCNAFIALGHQVTILTGKLLEEPSKIFSQYKIDSNINLQTVDFSIFFKNLKLWKIAGIVKLIKANKPDLLYTRNIKAAIILSFLGFKIIYEVHGNIFEKNSFIMKITKQKLLCNKNILKIVVISEALKLLIGKNKNIFNKTIVAHDAADEPYSNEKIELPDQSKYALKVGYTGHLYSGRGIDLILDIAEKIPDMAFYLVGGTEADINHWKKIVKTENVYFLGFILHKEIEKFQNSFDILLAPYQKNVAISGNAGNTAAFMSPLKVFEYMASNKAMVISNLPVLSEVLDRTIAIMPKYDDREQWIEALNSLRDENLRNTLANSAYTRFIQKHTWYERAKGIFASVSNFKPVN